MYSRRQILKAALVGGVYLSMPAMFLNKVYAQTDRFVAVQGGKFQMGSNANEYLREKDEVLHEVFVSNFYISKYAVT